MIYKEYIPSVELSKFIDKFWIVSDIENGFSQRIFPEACTNFVFSLNENKGSSNLLGANTTFSEFRPLSKDYFFGISFHPGILGIITKTDFSELKDSLIPTSDLFPTFNHLFLEQLNEQRSDWEKLKFVENELKNIFSMRTAVQSNFLTASVASSIKTDHTQSVEQLSFLHHTSTRQLQRKFKREVGISMKMFSRITRFNKAIDLIKSNKNKSLLSLSFDLGFYDHSHLTNEIKYFAGVQPSDLR